LYGRSEKDVERIKKIAARPDEIADEILQLIDSDKKTLKFWQEDWDYHLE
jgi:hypothetical protein